MQITYNEAMIRVYQDEGGYTNDAADPGGPTNYGITIHDARMYWKADASASDVRALSKSVAAEIYQKHYATPLHYSDLPPGVDYAVLDYGINSGISRAAKVLQYVVGVPEDGVIGPTTIAASKKYDPKIIVNAIYRERLAFLKRLPTWSTFGRGWSSRCSRGKALALSLISKYYQQPQKESPSMFNWKTTVAGVAAIFAAIGSLFTPAGTIDLSHLSTVLPAVLAGFGLIFAKDSNVTGGSVAQIPATPKAVAPAV